MSENQAAEQQQTEELSPEQVAVLEVAKFRNAIVNAAVENELSFDVVFAALSQVAVTFLFDFLLLSEGELSDANVPVAVKKFNDQLAATADVSLKNMREAAAKAQEDEQSKIIIAES